jgi:hypothetical protein
MHLMERVCAHPLTPRTIILLLDDPEMQGRIGPVDQWIGYPPVFAQAGWSQPGALFWVRRDGLPALA